jgi:hypothetical protein
MTPDNETYTYTEIDQLIGSWTYIGGLTHTLLHLLDVTNPGDLDLIEFANHAPAGLVVAVLPELSIALRESINRLNALDAAVASAIDSGLDRVVAEKADIEAAFESMMDKTFGDQAKKDGLA